jgi:hypothetical protein
MEPVPFEPVEYEVPARPRTTTARTIQIPRDESMAELVFGAKGTPALGVPGDLDDTRPYKVIEQDELVAMSRAKTEPDIRTRSVHATKVAMTGSKSPLADLVGEIARHVRARGLSRRDVDAVLGAVLHRMHVPSGRLCFARAPGSPSIAVSVPPGELVKRVSVHVDGAPISYRVRTLRDLRLLAIEVAK